MDLNMLCRRIRRSIVTTIADAGVGHIGGSLSEVEILAALYFRVMRIDPMRPDWIDRDRFILSKGHASPGLYCTLAARGYFEERRLSEFDRLGGMLQGHPCMIKTPGVDMSTGSLGQGLSAGIGMVLGRLFRQLTFTVFVLIGDGELQEGQNWEAAMYAGAHRLRGLVAIVDDNQVQLAATTRETLPLEVLAEKWRAFGWQTLECDGHDVDALAATLVHAKTLGQCGPVAVIAHTIKGKGVSFMEGRCQWHAKAPNDKERALALAELDDGATSKEADA
jgi:transketolase